MAKRHKQWARRKREQLMSALGATCARCGKTEDLTFDCIIPMGDKHHRFDTSARMSFYNAMLRVGNLQILCAKCNARKGAGPTLLTQTITAQL